MVFEDWERKFATLGLVCTELTGDTQQAQLRNVKSGDIIITTPEKWDSMTRRWEDHKKLLELVRLFLVQLPAIPQYLEKLLTDIRSMKSTC